MAEAWAPRRRSARPPRTWRGELAARWTAGIVCAGILLALLIAG